MALDLGALSMLLKVDGADKATSDLKKFGGEVDGTESKMGKFASKAGGIAKGAVVGLTGAVAAGSVALVGMAKESMGTADNIDKMSQKLGLSREGFQELDFICSQSGTSVESLAGGMKTLTKAAIDAPEKFEALGISVTDASGNIKSQEELLYETINALQGMEDGTEKARIAQDMLGKSGSELMPLLNGAQGSMEAMAGQAHELGLVLGDEAVDAGVAMTDQFDQMQRSFKSIVTQIGVQVMPIISKLLDVIIDNMPMIQEIMGKVFEFISTAIEPVLDAIGMLIEWISNLVESCKEDGSQMNEIWGQIKEMFQTTFNNIIEFVQAFIEAFQAFWADYGEGITMFIKGVWDAIKIVFEIAFNAFNDLLDVFTALFKGDWEGLWEAVKTLLSNAWDGIKALFESALDTTIDVLKNIVPKMLDAGKNMMTGLWDGIKSVWDNISTWVSDKISWLVDKLTFWDNGQKKMSNSTSEKGSYANGIDYVPYDMPVMVHKGERILTAEENAQGSFGNKDVEGLLRELITITKNQPREALKYTRMGVV